MPPESPVEIGALAAENVLDSVDRSLQLYGCDPERLADRSLVAAIVAKQIHLLQQRLAAQNLGRRAHATFHLAQVVREELAVAVVRAGRGAALARLGNEKMADPGIQA